MSFDVTRHDKRGPFRPAFRAGLWFCLVAPALLLPILNFLMGTLGYAAWLSDPWNMFGPGATFSDAPLRDLLTRTRPEWAAFLIPAGLCAALWWMVHRRRERLASPWTFVLVAITVPLLIGLIGVPTAAYEFDPRARATFDLAVKWLHQDAAISQRWSGFFQMLAVFLLRSLAWLNATLNLNAPRTTLLLSAMQTYALLVPATWLFARAVFAYAAVRNAGTLSAVAHAAANDVSGWARRTARSVASGLGEHGTPDAASRLARAVALPWLIPAACTLAFIIANKVFNLLPLTLVLLVLVAYVIARLTWRLAERFHVTSYRIGGAATGLLCAILAVMVCSIASIQAWVFMLQTGGTPKYSLLVSYLPPYIATIVSLGLGLRVGWRSAAVTPPRSTASQPV